MLALGAWQQLRPYVDRSKAPRRRRRGSCVGKSAGSEDVSSSRSARSRSRVRIVADLERQLSVLDALTRSIHQALAPLRSSSSCRSLNEPSPASSFPRTSTTNRRRSYSNASPSDHRTTPTSTTEAASMTDPKALVQKLWNYCNILRDDGLSYGDYVEQLTYLLFLKMADEQTQPPFNREPVVPYGLDWQSLLDRDGEELEAHYIKMLNDLGKQPGMLGVDLPQGTEPHPGPGEAPPTDRRPHRPGTMDDPRRGREGRRLRGSLAEERRGHQVRRGPVLHPTPAHQGDRRGHATRAGHDDLRPSLRDRRLPARRPRLHRRTNPLPRPRREADTCATTRSTAGRSSTTRLACAR